MLSKITSRLKFVYQYIVGSIGFYPTLIAFFFSLLAFLMLYLERRGLSEMMLDKLPFMIITKGDTAQLILSTISTGVISLTVFSFSMVMVVLNQAVSNFSPRVIPGIISGKPHQMVLGLYLGTLIYSLIVMVNIRSDFYSKSLPGFAIFLAMCLAILCLGFFVYFINSISKSIQIESLLEHIYKRTHERLSHEIEQDNRLQSPNIFEQGEWHSLTSPKTGYLQSIDKDAVVALCQKHDLVIDFEQPLGNFLIEGVPFARINRKIDNTNGWVEELMAHLNFYREERPDLNYLFGIKHITESAVKALSPGINDPGTAIKAIDYLTALFALRMQLTDEKVVLDKNGAARLRFAKETFENVLHYSLMPIRLYGKGSPSIVLRLLYLLRSLLYLVQPYPHLKPVLQQEASLLLQDAEHELRAAGDRQRINEKVKELNEMKVLNRPIPLLSTGK